ncbi:MAG: phosphate acyltransferase PlsX [Melioribacteraceae bacterium]|nr:phosphate acyltransferase PlsX [Melioribacteraceae bacterium]
MISNNNKKCVIAVDAMGSDNSPHNDVIGAYNAWTKFKSFELLLVGDKNEILKVANENNLNIPEDWIVHAPEKILMSDTPTTAIKTKKNSSIVIGASLVKEKKADAFVSAGNTGAMLTASTLIMGRIPGVGRPTIGASFPNQLGSFTLVFDAGASVDSKPQHLLEYSAMGTIFCKEIYGVANPSVGLLSVGEEESKGNELTFATNKLLKESKLNYIGNVEGRDILNGAVNVVVCDGFVGNIILKFGESVIGFLKAKMRTVAEGSLLDKIKVLIAKGALRKALSDLDYQKHGGVPLLGVNGISIIGHGSSTPLAIENMILRAKEMYDKNVISKFEEAIKDYAVK